MTEYEIRASDLCQTYIGWIFRHPDGYDKTIHQIICEDDCVIVAYDNDSWWLPPETNVKLRQPDMEIKITEAERRALLRAIELYESGGSSFMSLREVKEKIRDAKQ